MAVNSQKKEIMAPAFLMVVLFLQISMHFVYGGYKIGSFDETIINPSFPNHEIPVLVYYPTETGHVWPTIIFAHGFEAEATWYDWIYRDMVPLGFIVAYINSYPRGPLNGTQFAIDQRYNKQFFINIMIAIITNKTNSI